MKQTFQGAKPRDLLGERKSGGLRLHFNSTVKVTIPRSLFAMILDRFAQLRLLPETG